MTVWLLLVSLLLVLANGFFVAAEFALTAARRERLEQRERDGDPRAKLALASIRELALMLAGAQLGITMASLGLGYVAEPAIAHLLERGAGLIGDVPSGILQSVSFVVALAIVSFLHMVVGEMAPKNITIAEPESSALWVAIPFRVFVNVFRPFIHVLNWLANLCLRAFGIEPVDELRPTHTADEIGAMIAESAAEGAIDPVEHRLLSGAIVFGDLDAGAVMVPRTEMKAVSVSATPADLEQLVIDTGHTRFPVYGKSLDNIFGFFHSRDLFKIAPAEYDRPLPRRFIRPMLIVPESRRLHPLLFDMRRERKHLALVIDEHGGTAGMVTLEDLVEEIVGEIRDEYDDAEYGIERLGDGRYLAPGSLRIGEAYELIGIDLPPGEYETIAGFLMDRLQRIPKRRDEVRYDRWTIRVRTMLRRRVVQVLIERSQPTASGDDRRGAGPRDKLGHEARGEPADQAQRQGA